MSVTNNIREEMLRDHFAGQIIIEVFREFLQDPVYGPEDWRKRLATEAYALADAMIKVRNSTKPNENEHGSIP